MENENKHQTAQDTEGKPPIMKFFDYAHLPEKLQEVSKPYCDLAEHLNETIDGSAEKTVALRKLLESKDAAVRASL